MLYVRRTPEHQEQIDKRNGMRALKDTSSLDALRKLSRTEILLAGALVIIGCAAAYLPLRSVLRGYLLLTIWNITLLAVHAGAVPVYLALRPTRRSMLSFLVGVAVLYAPVAYVGNCAPIADSMRIILGAAGLAAIFCLMTGSIWAETEKRTLARHGLLAVFGLYLAVVVSRLLLVGISAALPITFDRYLYAFDAGLGGQLSFAVGRLFSRVPLLQALCLLVYGSLTFGVLFLFANLKGTARLRWLLLANFAFIGVVGRFCYSAVPAMGPIYQFPAQFPWNPPPVLSLTLQPLLLPPGMRNAMPSLHTAWALMLFWWTYRQPQWLRVAAGLFLFLTLLATLGLGEHYLVDLVVAVPFTLASFAVFTGFLSGNRVSWVALGVGLGLSIFWFVLFRSPMRITASQPQIAWPLSVSTVVLSLLVVPWRRIPSPTSGRTTNS